MLLVSSQRGFYSPQVFRETVISEWHLQVFTCRLSMTGDADEHVQNTATLRVTGECSVLFIFKQNKSIFLFL